MKKRRREIYESPSIVDDVFLYLNKISFFYEITKKRKWAYNIHHSTILNRMNIFPVSSVNNRSQLTIVFGQNFFHFNIIFHLQSRFSFDMIYLIHFFYSLEHTHKNSMKSFRFIFNKSNQTIRKPITMVC